MLTRRGVLQLSFAGVILPKLLQAQISRISKHEAFIQRPPVEDAFINIICGGLRSGKAMTTHKKVVQWLSRGWWPGGMGLITGYGILSLESSVLPNLASLAGSENYKYDKVNREVTLFGRKFSLVVPTDQNIRKIKGAEIGLWLGDETSLIKKNHFESLVSRLTRPTSRAYLVTHPDKPCHYLKKEWIDDKEKRRDGVVSYQVFKMRDNKCVPKELVEYYSNLYTGRERLRFIEGLWV